MARAIAHRGRVSSRRGRLLLRLPLSSHLDLPTLALLFRVRRGRTGRGGVGIEEVGVGISVGVIGVRIGVEVVEVGVVVGIDVGDGGWVTKRRLVGYWVGMIKIEYPVFIDARGRRDKRCRQICRA